MSAWPAPTSTSDLTPGDGVIQPQHHNGADGRDDHAPDIEAGDAAGAERGEQEAADHRADDAEQTIQAMIPMKDPSWLHSLNVDSPLGH